MPEGPQVLERQWVAGGGVHRWGVPKPLETNHMQLQLFVHAQLFAYKHVTNESVASKSRANPIVRIRMMISMLHNMIALVDSHNYRPMFSNNIT